MIATWFRFKQTGCFFARHFLFEMSVSATILPSMTSLCLHVSTNDYLTDVTPGEERVGRRSLSQPSPGTAAGHLHLCRISSWPCQNSSSYSNINLKHTLQQITLTLLLFSWLAHHSMLATCLRLEYCRAWFFRVVLL